MTTAVVVVAVLAVALWKALRGRTVQPIPQQSTGAYPVPPLPNAGKEAVDA